MATCLTDFKIIRPQYEKSQEDLLELIAEYHAKAESSINPSINKAEFLESIRQRVFSLGLGKDKIQKRGYFPLDSIAFSKEKGLSQKLQIFDQEMVPIFDAFYPDHIPLPSHIIQVSCTGYVAPSGAQRLVSQRSLGDRVSVTNAYHMGCYAAIPATRIAQGYLFASNEESDIVHTEMCTLHMNSYIHTTEQLIVQGLFADGFIKYRLKKAPVKGAHLKILAIHETIVPSSTSSMTWTPRESGFHLSIGKEVPVFIARAIDGYLASLAKKADLDVELLKKAHFAIHPGGPKIIENVAKMVQLSDDQIKYSKEILFQYGNMSSATLPHIWERILADKNIQSKELIVSLAFGPGLTIAGALFEKEDS